MKNEKVLDSIKSKFKNVDWEKVSEACKMIGAGSAFILPMVAFLVVQPDFNEIVTAAGTKSIPSMESGILFLETTVIPWSLGEAASMVCKKIGSIKQARNIKKAKRLPKSFENIAAASVDNSLIPANEEQIEK